jgi:hypothetical protein
MSTIIQQPQIHCLNDLLGLANRQYRIPVYQRNYEWGDEQIDDFLDDLFRLSTQDKEHFFGTLVFSLSAPENYDGPDTPRYIIDGQQRLTTSLLLLAGIRHQVLELSDLHPAGYGVAALIGQLLFNGFQGDIASQRSKLSANRENQVFLNAITTERTDGLSAVQKNYELLDDKRKLGSEKLYVAYKRIREELVRRCSERLGLDSVEGELSLRNNTSDPSEAKKCIEQLNQIFKHSCSNALFLEIHVDRWQDAFIIFEGLNNRGMELAEKDLTKNFVLSRAASLGEVLPATFTGLENTWNSIEGRIADTKFARFLRHYLLLFYKDVPIKRVVRILTEHFDEYRAEHIIEDLNQASIAYEKITRPSRESNTSLREAFERLNILGAERSYPIPLAASLSKIGLNNHLRLLRAVEVLYFRRSAIMQRDNKSIEADIREVAADLHKIGEAGVENALEELKKLTPVDDEFITHFEAKRDMKSSIVRYLLVDIENHLRKRKHPIRRDDTTLEHILPQSPAPWNLTKIETEKFPIMINRLGNLTLLSAPILSNSIFSKKVDFYRKENLSINQNVIDKVVWTSSEIVSRQRELAKIACKVWPR